MPRRKIIIDGKRPVKPLKLLFSGAMAADALQDIARSAVRGAIREINKGGRLGRVRPDGTRASLPGEAPHTYEGDLVKSFRVQETGIAPASVHIASTVDYARDHEFGARPFLAPEIPKAVLENPVAFAVVMRAK